MNDWTQNNGLNWDTDRFLYVHGVTTEEWAARYGMVPFSHPCKKCKKQLTTTLPWAQGSLRGLRAPPCECGNTETPYCMVRDRRVGALFAPVEDCQEETD